MTDTHTPAPPASPVPPSPVAPPPRPPRRSSAGLVVAIIAIVVGGLVIAGTAFTAVASTTAAALVRTETRALELGITRVGTLDVELSAGSLQVLVDDSVDRAQLEVTGSSGTAGWTLEQHGDTLRVASPQHLFSPGWWFGGTSRAVLQLPAQHLAQPVDADFRVSAGELTSSADFARLGLRVDAGKAVLSGTANSVTADLSAGAADLDLAGVETADLTVTAGSLTSRFSGPAPAEVSADVSAGSLVMTVPPGDYDVRSDVSAGRFQNSLGATPGASNRITVQVSAGQAVLRAG